MTMPFSLKDPGEEERVRFLLKELKAECENLSDIFSGVYAQCLIETVKEDSKGSPPRSAP